MLGFVLKQALQQAEEEFKDIGHVEADEQKFFHLGRVNLFMIQDNFIHGQTFADKKYTQQIDGIEAFEGNVAVMYDFHESSIYQYNSKDMQKYPKSLKIKTYQKNNSYLCHF